MTIAVVGLGSMGKRRSRLLDKILKDTDSKIIGIDTNKERQTECNTLFNMECFDSLNEAAQAVGKIDCVVISTSPLSHYPIIKQALQFGCDVFTELNLVDDGYDELIKLSEEKQKILFLSSTPLYSNDVKLIIQKAKNQNNLTYNFHIGQYLPDWHPWESYKNFFVADKKTNACREIFAINLPWLEAAFGKITDVYTERKKSTNLELDYPDNYIATIRHENGNSGVFCMDVVCRKAVQRFEMYSENLYINWEGKPDSLKEYDFEKKKMVLVQGALSNAEQDSRYAEFIVEENYEDELRAFLECVNTRKNKYYGFKEDKEILGWISKIEGGLK